MRNPNAVQYDTPGETASPFRRSRPVYVVVAWGERGLMSRGRGRPTRESAGEDEDEEEEEEGGDVASLSVVGAHGGSLLQGVTTGRAARRPSGGPAKRALREGPGRGGPLSVPPNERYRRGRAAARAADGARR